MNNIRLNSNYNNSENFCVDLTNLEKKLKSSWFSYLCAQKNGDSRSLVVIGFWEMVAQKIGAWWTNQKDMTSKESIDRAFSYIIENNSQKIGQTQLEQIKEIAKCAHLIELTPKKQNLDEEEAVNAVANSVHRVADFLKNIESKQQKVPKVLSKENVIYPGSLDLVSQDKISKEENVVESQVFSDLQSIMSEPDIRELIDEGSDSGSVNASNEQNDHADLQLPSDFEKIPPEIPETEVSETASKNEAKPVEIKYNESNQESYWKKFFWGSLALGIGLLAKQHFSQFIENMDEYAVNDRVAMIKDGVDTFVLKDNSVFLGPIRDGLPAGTGILRTEFGEEEYIASGYGKLEMQDSSEFIGSIENHSPSGYGELRTEDGNLIKEGIFHGNKLVKEIRTIHLPDSSELFRGEVDESGNPHGLGVFFTEKGMYFGKFDHGHFVGEKPQEKNSKILLFTSYTPDRGGFNKIIIDNQKEYAEAHGYHYMEFLENSAKKLESEMTEKEGNVLPYWSKVAGMLELLHLLDPEKFPEKFRAHLPTEFIWLDDDAAITNQMVKMEEVVEHYAPENSQTHVFLTQDSMHELGFDLNTAVLFVRNSKESRVVFSELWDRRHKLFMDRKYVTSTYATCPSQSCLHEQAALQDLVKLDQYSSKKYVRIIPQYDQSDPVRGWGINTFARESHIDKQRNEKMSYISDDPLTRWKPGHFIGQATGMASDGHLLGDSKKRENLRKKFMEAMTENT